VRLEDRAHYQRKPESISGCWTKFWRDTLKRERVTKRFVLRRHCDDEETRFSPETPPLGVAIPFQGSAAL
jgi:hypothetical protein